MTIRELCYELYKIDWLRRITPERKMDTLCQWYTEDEDHESFDEYIEECGYDGELYVCYNEFLGAEYLDKEYIAPLLRERGDWLTLAYFDDLKRLSKEI